MIVALLLTIFGGFLCVSAIRTWRNRRGGNDSLLESAILKITGAEPRPQTWLDRALQSFDLILTLFIGSLILLVGVAFIIIKLEIIP